jgi:CRP-like cAMP-binding protein
MFFIRKGTAHVSSVSFRDSIYSFPVLCVLWRFSLPQVLQTHFVKTGGNETSRSSRQSPFTQSLAGLRGNIPELRVVREMSDGDSFGELSMLFDRRRTATVVAATILELASLSKADFVHVIQEFPELAPEFEKNIGGYAMVGVLPPVVCSVIASVTRRVF